MNLKGISIAVNDRLAVTFHYTEQACSATPYIYGTGKILMEQGNPEYMQRV